MDESNYFAHCTDELFWGDKERVNLLITLYEKHECLWDVTSSTYKNILKKKQAKKDWQALWDVRYVLSMVEVVYTLNCSFHVKVFFLNYVLQT